MIRISVAAYLRFAPVHGQGGDRESWMMCFDWAGSGSAERARAEVAEVAEVAGTLWSVRDLQKGIG